MQIPADLPQLHQRRRLAGERLLAQLGRAPRHPQRGIESGLVGRVGQRLQRRRRTPPSRSRAPAPLPNDGGGATSSLTAIALDGDADRLALGRSDHRDDLRQLRERGERRLRVLRGADHGQVMTGVTAAAHVSGHLAAERLGDGSHQLAAAVEQQPACRRRPRTRGPARPAAAPRSSHRCPGPRAAGPRPPPHATPRRCGCPAPAPARSTAARSAPGSARGRPARARARARAPPARRSPPSRPAPAGAPRCRSRCPRSSRTRPSLTRSATGSAALRMVSAARR